MIKSAPPLPPDLRLTVGQTQCNGCGRQLASLMSQPVAGAPVLLHFAPTGAGGAPWIGFHVTPQGIRLVLCCDVECLRKLFKLDETGANGDRRIELAQADFDLKKVLPKIPQS